MPLVIHCHLLIHSCCLLPLLHGCSFLLLGHSCCLPHLPLLLGCRFLLLGHLLSQSCCCCS